MGRSLFRSHRRAWVALALLTVLFGLAQGASAKTQPCNASPAVTNVAFGAVSFSQSTTDAVGPKVPVSVNIHCPPAVFNGNQNAAAMVIAVRPAGGTYDGTNGWLIPTSDPNLSVLIKLESTDYPIQPGDVAGTYVIASLSQGNPDWSPQFTAQLIKRPGAVGAITVPYTLMEFSNSKDGAQAAGVDFASLAIGSGGIQITSLSCSSSSSPSPVQLPVVSTRSLASVGATAGKTAFRVEVANCPEGTQLSIAWSGAAIDAAAGVLQSSGSDPDVAVQLFDGDTDQPVDISGTQKKALGTVLSNGETIIGRYYAQYYAVQPATGGNVSAAVTYTLSYP